MSIERQISEIAEVVRNAKDHHGSTILIGAGVSYSAGIPLASGVVEEIKRQNPVRCASDPSRKSYADFMRVLSANERKRLIVSMIDKAKINWAHIAIAQLIKHGYITRVLTTNFDPLVARACALINQFPAIYDFANPPAHFDTTMVHDRAIFHLHGQYTGFALKNTENELQGHAKRLNPLFNDSIAGRPIIVAGYSGECDPVFECLSKLTFGESLHWVTYMDATPAKHVSDLLRGDENSAYKIPGYDADGFFCKLAQELGCFPPALIEKPFEHLKCVLETLSEYIPHGQSTPNPILQQTFEDLNTAEAHIESLRGRLGLPPVQELWARLMAGEHAEVAAIFSALTVPMPDDYVDVASAAFYNWGNALAGRARQSSGADARSLYKSACEKYAAAVAVKPDKHEALNNWGVALSGIARQSSGAEARGLYESACEKYAAAVAVKPDKHEALNNWGLALARMAGQSSGAEVRGLYKSASEKFAAAVAVKPDMHEALYNWGVALADMAGQSSGTEARGLYDSACEKYAAAVAVKPDKHQALKAWGSTLFYLSVLSEDEAERVQLLNSAREKCLLCEGIKEGGGAYNLACIAARLGEGDEAKRWLEKSKAAGRLPDRAHVEGDADLESVRGEAWFLELLEGLG